MKRRTAVFAFGGVMLSGLLPAVAAGAVAANTAATNDVLSIENNTKFLADYAKTKGVIVRPSGLMFRIIQNGYGKRPGPTDTVKVYYTGKLINGVIFDGTSPGLPASFKLNGGLVTGWVEALQLMREGDHWQLVIPPNLGYGERGGGNGLIPPSQDLIFDLKLIETTPAPKRGEKGYVPEAGDKDQEQ
jgi:FKBP-type peptidyl-prolyl cis-trans isomerase